MVQKMDPDFKRAEIGFFLNEPEVQAYALTTFDTRRMEILRTTRAGLTDDCQCSGNAALVRP